MTSMELVDLQSLQAGETVTVVAGEQPEAFTYMFKVITAGQMPLCELTQTGPDGTVVGPAKARLEGSGNWTTEAQNPMQRADIFLGRSRQELAMSIGYGLLSVGNFVIISDPETTNGDRLQLEPACTSIELGHTV